MANISLRAYNREIENLIEKGAIEEAISHAKHILQYYPKYIETYRLLGKAFLESHRYTEASDILERVLSVIPDDFIAQIGMSIIREDEGNLDAAIWHMERAFEVQPANIAVQDELRRLYGRRDGTEPPKVRLTSGGLIRMYVRGELFGQAISEILSVLKDDPKRHDLEVILARMYAQTDQKEKAVQTAYNLVAKLPYCYEANRLLAALLPEMDKSDEAQEFVRRLQAIDPYEAFVNSGSPTAADVPDAAILIEKAESPGTNAEAPAPDWMHSIGISWEDSKLETPEWLQQNQIETGENSGQSSAPLPTNELEQDADLEISDLPSAQTADDQTGSISDLASTLDAGDTSTELPDWLSAAGWEPATGPEQPPAPSFESDTDSEEALAPADIPDWLKSIAPQEEASTEASAEELEKLQSIFDSSKPFEEAGQDLDQGSEPGEVLPDWMSAVESANIADVGRVGVTDFLNSLNQSDEEIAPSAGSPESVAGEVEGEPEGLSSRHIDLPVAAEMETAAGEAAEPVSPSQEQPAAGSSDLTSGEDLPDWLLDVVSGSEDAGQNVLPIDSMQGMDNLTAGMNLEPLEERSDRIEPFPAAQTAPDAWQQGTENAPDSPDSSLPEWLNEIQETETPSEPVDKPAVEFSPALGSVDFTAGGQEDLPAWLAEETPPTQNLSFSATPQDHAESELISEPFDKTESSDLPDWLSEEIQSSAPSTQESPMPAQADIPDWLREAENSIDEMPLADTSVLSDESSTANNNLNNMDIESALAWMEGLAEKHGADNETLFVPKEDRLEQPPEWLTQGETAETPAGSAEGVPAQDDEPQAGSQAAQAVGDGSLPPLPDWLEHLHSESKNGSFAPQAAQYEPTFDAVPATSEDDLIAPEFSAEDLAGPLPDGAATGEIPASYGPPTEEAVPTGAPAIPGDLVDSTGKTSEFQEGINKTADEALNPILAARECLLNNDVAGAISNYQKQIQNGVGLAEVIEELHQALVRFPVNLSLLQTLGDAYLRNDQLKEALEVYSKAEALLK